jgi:2-polyprenyl-3-methyl-5-hydroxy-6-metoxy-1,4-benzoquinol methylase
MDIHVALSRLEYVARSALRLFADRGCPFCGSTSSRLIKRKYLVTALRRCRDCQLLFRVPKAEEARQAAFYDREYRQGLTTALPAHAELAEMVARGFRGTERDYTSYLEVLEACGVPDGARVYDFGASWGYGSWQLASAGYCVVSYEISAQRAAYAAAKLGCHMLTSPTDLDGPVDCLFAAHVIEHLPRPSELWELASAAVSETGVVVLFMPNGEMSRADANPQAYHKQWGQVHPLLLTAAALSNMARCYGFAGTAYSSPYDLERMRRGEEGTLEGDELCFVARRASRAKPRLTLGTPG